MSGLLSRTCHCCGSDMLGSVHSAARFSKSAISFSRPIVDPSVSWPKPLRRLL